MERLMRQNTNKEIDKKLSKRPLCYVLVTCQEANADGNMQVEMTYEGDAALASYLLHGAQQAIEEQITEIDLNPPKKILSFGG